MELVKQVRQCGTGMGIGNMMLNDRVAVCFLNDRLSQKIAGRCNGAKHIPVNMTHRTNLKRIKTVLKMFEDVYVNELDFDLIKTLRKADVQFKVYRNKLKKEDVHHIRENGVSIYDGIGCSYELDIKNLTREVQIVDYWYVGFDYSINKKRGEFNKESERSFIYKENAVKYVKDEISKKISVAKIGIEDLERKLAKVERENLEK